MPAYKDCYMFREFDEERDLQDCDIWCIDAKDCIPALKPFEMFLSLGADFGMSYASEMVSGLYGVPTWRTKDGFTYLSRIKLSEEQKRQREPVFRQKLVPWIDDFQREWRGKYVPELEEGFQRLKKADLGTLSDPELRVHFQAYVPYVFRMWEIHMLNHYAGGYIYGLFEDICKELLGIDEQHPQFKALLSGFDNRIFQVDRELYRLGSLAIELGLAGTFEAITDDEKLLSELENSTKGKLWLRELHECLDENGWRTTRVWDVSNPTWVEKPSLALPNVRLAIAKGGVFALVQERERLARQREELEKEVLSRVQQDKRAMFEKLMRATQWIGAYSEEHLFYCEHYTNGLGRYMLMEIGRRFARTRTIEETEDILFLLPDEIAVRVVPAGFGTFHVRKLIQIRKEQYQENLKAEPPIFIGDVSKVGEVLSDEICLRCTVAGVPVVKPELKADLYGSNSAPGVAEGRARVIFSVDEFNQVQPGEILVTVGTSPTWTPLFTVAKGAVTDTGGGLTHAVIVGREFGLPVVAGTMEATRKIKTGDMIRVDGDNCCVYILE